MDAEKLNEKLVMLRREQGLTQDELALKVGVTRQTVSKWERGVIAPSTVNLIALGRLYGVPLDELANGGLPLEERPATAVAVAEKPEAAEPSGKPGPLKLAAAIVLAVCVLLVAAASVITIWSAVFKEPETPKDGLTIVNQDELEWEDIDLTKVIDMSESSGIFFNYKQ